jgi:hypothetical protein
MSKKPYIYEHLEWLEIFQRKDWNDPTINPDDLAEYSELQRPYALPDGEDSYPAWEWTWPDLNWPDIPPIIQPDPIKSPCSLDDDCAAVGIVGPDDMECGDCYTYTHVHVIMSCEPAWWMAFGSWTLESETQDGKCYLLFSGPIMATVCCEDAAYGSAILTYEGPLECSDSMQIVVSCDTCCGEEGWTLTGADTVVQGNTWTGTISPACPGTTCEVSSNSGCSLSCNVNDAGSEVTVGTAGTDCGQVTVTITNPGGENCVNPTATANFRITGGGNWDLKETSTDLCQSGCGGGDGSCGGAHCNAGGAIDNPAPCVSEPYKYGSGCTGGNPPCCMNTWTRQCKGTIAGCVACTPPPCGPGLKSCSTPYYCSSCGWWRCEWKCSC